MTIIQLMCICVDSKYTYFCVPIIAYIIQIFVYRVCMKALKQNHLKSLKMMVTTLCIHFSTLIKKDGYGSKVIILHNF